MKSQRIERDMMTKFPLLAKIYTVVFEDPNGDEFDNDAMLIWAHTPEEASQHFIKTSEFAYDFPHDHELRIHNHPHMNGKCHKGKLPREETNLAIMRDCGWRSESDRRCDECERYSFEEPQWAVCGECYLCVQCAKDESEHECGTCNLFQEDR